MIPSREPPLLQQRDALFLDFDGTLAELAPRPDLVHVEPELQRQLTELRERLHGAVAVVTGRRLADLDAFLEPLVLAGAGLHGAELRTSDGERRNDRFRNGVRLATGALRTQFDRVPGVMVEDKDLAVAVHYRNAPEREDECMQAVSALAARHGLEVLRGKMVIEARGAGTDKGGAIRALMAADGFRKRRPVFLGDDVTDEDGFAVVDALGGVSVKIGAGDSAARHRLADVGAVHDWLDRSLQALAGDSRRAS